MTGEAVVVEGDDGCDDGLDECDERYTGGSVGGVTVWALAEVAAVVGMDAATEAATADVDTDAP